MTDIQPRRSHELQSTPQLEGRQRFNGGSITAQLVARGALEREKEEVSGDRGPILVRFCRTRSAENHGTGVLGQ
eukprot:scaffold278_cov362-Pinguiococcus_pyrenoidosus.AAC.3